MSIQPPNPSLFEGLCDEDHPAIFPRRNETPGQAGDASPGRLGGPSA